MVLKKETISNKSIVVTGGAGFIGSHLCDKLLKLKPKRIIIIDDLSLGKMRNIRHLLKDSRVSFHKLDVSKYGRMAKLFEKEPIDVVFNLAVIPLPRSLKEPKVVIDKNILISSTICELQRNKLYKTLIHCSSSEGYGTALYVPMDEDHPTKPLTPYAASKIAGDHIAISYYRTFNLDIAIVRPFNAYGPRQNEGSYAGIIPIVIQRILSGKPPIIYGDGLQTRDFSYVEDTAEAIVKIFETPSTRGLTVNIASGNEVCIKDLVSLICKLTDYKGEIIYADPRPADVRRHKGDISLAKELIGYRPTTSYESGLLKTVNWYRSLLTNKVT